MKPLRLYGEDWFPLVRDEFVPGVGWVKVWTATRLVNRCGVVIAAQPRGDSACVKYATIVADPPWLMRRGGSAPTSSWAKPRPGILPYPQLTVREIVDLPVGSMADDAAHLYLWTINRYVEDAYDIARAWGFKPSTLLTWCKSPNGLGLGGSYSLTTEFCLFARRGVCPASERIDSTWWLWKRGRHSQKPEAFQDMVERVSPGPYLELFARRKRIGWDVWGNEVESDIELVA